MFTALTINTLTFNYLIVLATCFHFLSEAVIGYLFLLDPTVILVVGNIKA